MKKFLFLSLILSVVACAPITPQVDVNNQQAVSDAITTEYDEFRKITSFKAPEIIQTDRNRLLLRAFKEDSGNTIYQIYTANMSNGWVFYNSVYDSDGNKLNFTKISSQVVSCVGGGRCLVREDIGVNISRDYLEKHQSTGIRFKASGRNGESIYFIPGAYIRAFLSKI